MTTGDTFSIIAVWSGVNAEPVIGASRALDLTWQRANIAPEMCVQNMNQTNFMPKHRHDYVKSDIFSPFWTSVNHCEMSV